MKVNHNISAVISNKQLLRTEDSLSASMERLSSGLRINSPGDDPSGMAISTKMQAQIDGLDQASRNSSDGTSVLETADGALHEVTQMIQRMRELAVQAANDTNSLDEREAIQLEIDSLRDEITRVSETTEFNTKSLLNGSLDNRVYADYVSNVYVSEDVESGIYKFSIDEAATQAVISGGVTLDSTDTSEFITEDTAGVVDINGYKVTLTAGMTQAEVYEALRDGAEIGEATISESGEALSFTSTAYGSEASLTITIENEELASVLGLSAEQTASGTSAQITLDTDSDFGSQATVSYEGNKVTISDVKGFEMTMVLDAGVTTDDDNPVLLEVTDIGPMKLQIGANQYQQMAVKIPDMSSTSLYLDDVDVRTVHGASNAITDLDEALTFVSAVRSSLGAYTNRLEYTTESLDAAEENMTAGLSRLADIDMAEEMTEYTRLNVLSQAGTSALSQANELPELALQLLG